MDGGAPTYFHMTGEEFNVGVLIELLRTTMITTAHYDVCIKAIQINRYVFRSNPTFELFQHDYVNDPTSLISNSINAMANFAQFMQKDEGILTRGFMPYDEPLPVVPINQASSVALLCHNNAILDDKFTSPVGRNFHWQSSDINAFIMTHLIRHG